MQNTLVSSKISATWKQPQTAQLWKQKKDSISQILRPNARDKKEQMNKLLKELLDFQKLF